MSRICHRKLYERPEVRVEIADVEPPLGGPEQHAVHASSLPQQLRIASVSWISPPAPGGVRSRAAKICGDRTYRAAMASVLGASAGRGFSTRSARSIRLPDPPSRGRTMPYDAVVFPPDLFEGDDGGCVRLVERVGHPPHDVALTLEPDDRIAERYDEGRVADERARRKHGVSQPERLALPRVEDTARAPVRRRAIRAAPPSRSRAAAARARHSRRSGFRSTSCPAR